MDKEKSFRASPVLKKAIVAVALLVLTCLISTSLSSFVLWPNAPKLDSSVFRYVGMVMQRGGVPYRDVFDHKGPLIFLLNYLGLFLGNNGIWFIELILLFFTAVFIFRTIRLFCGPYLSLVGTAAALLLTYDFLGGGNYTEEYALPFISCAVFIFAEYFLKSKTTRGKLILCGACFMAVALLRVNMVGTWAVFALTVIIKSIREKSGKLIAFILFFLLGAVLVLLPFLVYFALNSALDDFWEQYFVFNFAYSSVRSGSAFSAIRHFLFSAPCAVALVINVVCVITAWEKSWIDWANLAYIAVSLLLIGMSGRTYNHYGIIIAPLTVIPTARLFQFLDAKADKKKLMLCTFALLLLLLQPWVKGALNRKSTAPPDQTLEGIISKYIRQNTTEDDLIIQCGHKDVFYVLSGRMAASKYSYPLPIAMIDNKVYDLFFEDLAENKPAVIITDSWTEQDQLDYTEINKRLEEFIADYEYVKGPSLESYTLYYPKNSDLGIQYLENHHE